MLCGGSVELCECCEVFDDVMIGGMVGVFGSWCLVFDVLLLLILGLLCGVVYEIVVCEIFMGDL